MADIECPWCGHRALRVATRCPGCGGDIPAELREAAAQPERGRLRPLLLVGGALAALIIVGALLRGGEGPGRAVVTTDSLATSETPATVVMPAPADSTPPDSGPPSPAPPPPPPAGLEQRYAATWINLRVARNAAAAVVRILQPGEVVTVDSLRRGWYRVVSGGRTEGYAHRRYLSTTRPGGGGRQ